MPNGWGFRHKPGLVTQEIYFISSATSELLGVRTFCILITEQFITVSYSFFASLLCFLTQSL